MAQVFAPFPVIGTFKCGITFYMDGERNLARKKSSLTGRRVKTSPEFARTRANAANLKDASPIASVIYQALPAYFKQFWMFKAFTGEAMQLLKAGKTREEAIGELWKMYVKEHEERDAGYKIQGTGCGKKRRYRKTVTTYWENKTAKANKRKAQKEKLQYYAGLMAKASKIGSAAYKSLPDKEKQYWKYKGLTGVAMRMLKEGMEEDEVREFLMKETGGLKPNTGSKGEKFRQDGAGYEIRKEVKYIPTLKMHSIVCIPWGRFSLEKRDRLKRKSRLLARVNSMLPIPGNATAGERLLSAYLNPQYEITGTYIDDSHAGSLFKNRQRRPLCYYLH